MDNLITIIFGLIQLVFVLWFTFSVVEKLKRSERLLRELLRHANPHHSYFAEIEPRQPAPPPEPYTAEQIKKVMNSPKSPKKLDPDAPYIC
jgi:hypothetical protein